MSVLATELLAKFKEPSARSHQVKIGPSGIGGCPYCVGEALAHRLPEVYPDLVHVASSSYATWLGTIGHSGIEHEYFYQQEICGNSADTGIAESKVHVYDLEGYGSISGSIDLIYGNEIFDWKFMGKFGYDKMCLAYRRDPTTIPDVTYRVQQMLYAYGARKAGFDIERVNVVVFPKHKSNWSDVRVFTEEYNQELVDAALDRLEKIWKIVQEGKYKELPSNEDCYNCNNGGW
jgi:CRISPR/Cas system-associated exonuclease Cas4 (RecB family)